MASRYGDWEFSSYYIALINPCHSYATFGGPILSFPYVGCPEWGLYSNSSFQRPYEKVEILNHRLRSGLIPVVTTGAVQLGMLIGGAITMENVFSWPGIGRFLVQSVATRDYPTIQAGLLILITAIALLNFLVDLSYGLLDPRIRLSSE
jgi:hypothetical protein